MIDTFLARFNVTVTRNLSAVSLHKLVQITGVAVTVVLVPRLFGVEMYGQFAFALSLSYLGQILGDFGTLDVMGRFVPGMDPADASRLYMRHLGFKVVVGLLAGLVTFWAAILLAGWMRPGWALLIAGGVTLHILAWIPYQFALGLNRVGTWMSEQAWRQWVLLGLLLFLLPWLGLTGALLAVVIMECLFLGLGLWWVRSYWDWSEIGLAWRYLVPYLRFGFGFFMANLAAVALFRSGPLVVEVLTGSLAQTGFFNLALGLFLLAYVTLGQFGQSLIPELSQAFNQQEFGRLRGWLRTFTGWGWWLGVLGVVVVWSTADWGVPLLFGRDYAPAGETFKWISLGIPVAALLWGHNIAATVLGYGHTKFMAAVIALLLFLVGAGLFVPGYGATGAAIALVVALMVNTGIMVVTVGGAVRALPGYSN
jgi:O-antigen/teichoic acid export membrane protein